MFKKLLTTRSLCLSAIIAALYAALTLLLAPISYGNIQCRVSEAFTVLPMVLPQSIPGLFVGCLIANIFSPTPSIWDIVFGSLTTLIAACGTYALRKKPVLAAACPVVANGVIVGLMLALRRIQAAWCCRRIRWWRWMGRHWASRTPRRKRSRCCPCCPGGGIRCTQACAPWMRRAWFISGS